MMDGCVKILYLKVYGGILGCCGQDDVIMEEYQIQFIDMVVVNLYLFVQIVVCEGCLLEDVVENIDIGGLMMVCFVVKNYKDVVIVVKSSDYDVIIKEMDDNEGLLMFVICFDFVIKVFEYIVVYDSMIVNYFGSMVLVYYGESKEVVGCFLCMLNLNFIKKLDMCYGENSYQQVVFYIEENVKEVFVVIVIQVQGKVFFYNNIVDIDVVLECVKEFVELVCVIVKYVNFCGVVIGNFIFDVYDCVYKIDLIFVFGGIIVFNCELDVEIVQVIIFCQFVEVIIVLFVSEEVLKIIVVKQNVCVLICGQWGECVLGFDFKCVNGGLLVQDCDLGMVGVEELCVVIKCQLSEQELCDVLFCWKVVKFVKFNVIVYVKNNMIIGIGVGQMSCVYFVKIVGIKVVDEGLEVKGFLMVFDVFFLFCDGIDVVVVVGVICVIQFGGFICDDEVIVVVDEYGIVMFFIDMCYFCY